MSKKLTFQEIILTLQQFWNAAAKVPSKYRKITVFILVFCPF